MSSSSNASETSERVIPGRSVSPAHSISQRAATIRLGSPVLGSGFPQQGGSGSETPPLQHSGAWPGKEALAALNFPSGSSPPRLGTPSRFSTPPLRPGLVDTGGHDSSNYGSFDSRQPIEDLEIVRRHLVTDDNASQHGEGPSGSDEEFNSLQLQGGDITRPIYRYVEQTTEPTGRGRSMSFHLRRPEPEDDTENMNHIKAVGGFRRDFLRRTQGASPNAEGYRPEGSGFFTRSFIEFLTLHGHFAGEDLEDDEGWEPDAAMLAEQGRAEGEEGEGETERGPLLARRQSIKKPSKIATGTAGSGKAILLLLKSFVGTGVLFLPKAYLNGGMLFSNLVLLIVSLLSYYCFVLLVRTRLKVEGSFGGELLPRCVWSV
jgi:proton-coupled amino acid transporter